MPLIEIEADALDVRANSSRKAALNPRPEPACSDDRHH